jgi:hypothetical protein
MAEQTENQTPEQAQPQNPGPILLTRRQRRWMQKQQGLTRYIQKLPLADRLKLQRQNQENGRKLHQQHLDIQEQRNHTRLERILEGYTNEEGEKVPGLKDNWAAQGYNQKEIDMLEEAWSLSVIKDKTTYQADKKKRRALEKEAKASRDARKK